MSRPLSFVMKRLALLATTVLLAGCTSNEDGTASTSTTPTTTTPTTPTPGKDYSLGTGTFTLGPQDAPPASTRSGVFTVEIPTNATQVRMDLEWTSAASNNPRVTGIPNCEYHSNGSLTGDGTNTIPCGHIPPGNYTITAQHDTGTIRLVVNVIATGD